MILRLAKNVKKNRMTNIDIFFMNKIIFCAHNMNIRLILVEIRVLKGLILGFLKFEQRFIIAYI